MTISQQMFKTSVFDMSFKITETALNYLVRTRNIRENHINIMLPENHGMISITVVE